MKVKLNENKNNLNNVKTTDKKILMVKLQLTSYISQFTDNLQVTLTESIVNDITNKVNHFIDLSNINETDNTYNLDILIWNSKIVKELKIIDLYIKKICLNVS